MQRCCICPGSSLRHQVLASSQITVVVTYVRPNKAAQVRQAKKNFAGVSLIIDEGQSIASASLGLFILPPSYPTFSSTSFLWVHRLDMHFLSKKYSWWYEKNKPLLALCEGIYFFHQNHLYALLFNYERKWITCPWNTSKGWRDIQAALRGKDPGARHICTGCSAAVRRTAAYYKLRVVACNLFSKPISFKLSA